MTAPIRRLAFEDLASPLQAMLKSRVERLGYLGEFFRCAGNQPAVLAPFLEMTEALKAVLPPRLTEVGALTVATLFENDYERHQHERLSRALGFDARWIAAVEAVAPDASAVLSEEERVVQRLLIALIERHGKAVSVELCAAVDVIGPERTIALLFLAGRYITHALIVNALELEPPVASIFEEQNP